MTAIKEKTSLFSLEKKALPMFSKRLEAEDILIGMEERIKTGISVLDESLEGGFVKGTVGGVKMFFMFRSFMNSAVTAPSFAEKDAMFFVTNFFDTVMGDEDKGPESMEDLDKKLDELLETKDIL